jgi:translocation and assembly module TamB
MEDDLPESPPKRRWTKRHFFGAVLLLLLLLLAIAWWQRVGIVDSFIRDELEKNGVKARYKIEDIGLRTQRLSNVVLGDAANPDLTVQSLEIDTTIGFGRPQVRAIRASGVRVKGRFAGGALYLGELDKFRDMQSKAPISLPDLNVALNDAILSLATPWGGIGISAQGEGNLRSRFDGKVRVRSRQISGSGCVANGLRYDGTVRIRNVRPEFVGPLAAASAKCDGQQLALDAPLINGKLQFTEAFDRWIGDVAIDARSVRYGNRTAAGLAGKLDFEGNRQRTGYRLSLNQARLDAPEIAVDKLSGQAEGTVSFGEKGFTLASRGSANLASASLPPSMLPPMDGLVRGAKATPIGPVVARLAPALGNAARSFGSSLDFDLAIAPAAYTVMIDGMVVRSDSGLILRQESGFAVREGKLTDPLSLSMNGGDLPAGRLQLRSQGGGWAGALALDPYSAPGGSVSIPKLVFDGGGRRPWRFSGQATLTGPLMGGTITGLSLPFNGTVSGDRFAMNSACTDVRYSSLATGALHLPAGQLRACPQRGSILQVSGGETQFGFSVPSLALTGSLGESPLRASGSVVTFDLDRGFGANNVSVDLGQGDSISSFTVARFDGLLDGPGVRGTIKGGAGQIGNVPLLISEAEGQWYWRGDVLGLDSLLFVSDAAETDRFNRLKVPDFQLTLSNSQISAMGNLFEPESAVKVADAQILHNLDNSRGNALLSVDDLQFNDRLQPEQITSLTLGHIAEVQGRISGDGRIDWDADGVRSSGRFSVAPTDLAAAFGPVDGLSTDMVFTDLLGMVTEPGQIARLRTVNPGIPAFDGVIRYQLLPDQKVKIEEGRWPFYGGELILEPTVLDFDVEAKRELTFRLVGLDAEKFLGGYDLENLRVSGVFDGTLPMVFDQEGGRIVGGWLVSRPGGGEVSYLGQLTYEDMGAMANFAFEALRSVRFDEMQIGVDGNIGGEVVTEVRFRGLQQGSVAKRNFITRQLAKLPIEFTVRIEAEFLSLIGSLRTLYDAEYAAQRYKGYLDAPPPPITGEEEPTL